VESSLSQRTAQAEHEEHLQALMGKHVKWHRHILLELRVDHHLQRCHSEAFDEYELKTVAIQCTLSTQSKHLAKEAHARALSINEWHKQRNETEGGQGPLCYCKRPAERIREGHEVLGYVLLEQLHPQIL